MFDVEEYRADLERRRDALVKQEMQYHQKWRGSKRDSDLGDAERCMNKARGIEIALSLLPKKENDLTMSERYVCDRSHEVVNR